MVNRFFILLFLLLIGLSAYQQSFFEPSITQHKKRTIGVTTVGGLAWAGSISALGFVWYSNFEKSNFHFFDDSHEWNQMDKMGHLYVGNHVANFISSTYRWAGVPQKRAALYGSIYSFGYMATFELLDAYNVKWGFSWSDIGFNTLGVGFFWGQEHFWGKQQLKFKFSAHQSNLAQYRPAVLGDSYPSRILKDYNGQTYWASFNPIHWFNKDSKIPKWLTFSLGYSINNQLIGNGDTYVIATPTGSTAYTPYRQFFFSLDIDWEEIETKSRFLRIVFKGLNKVKLPFPALEMSRGALIFKPLYF